MWKKRRHCPAGIFSGTSAIAPSRTGGSLRGKARSQERSTRAIEVPPGPPGSHRTLQKICRRRIPGNKGLFPDSRRSTWMKTARDAAPAPASVLPVHSPSMKALATSDCSGDRPTAPAVTSVSMSAAERPFICCRAWMPTRSSGRPG